MASLLRMVGNVFRQKRDQAAKKLADPVRDGNFAVQDAKKQICGWTTDVAKLRAATIKIEADHKAALTEKKKYDKFAQKAAEAGNADDVQKAAAKVLEWDNRAKELKGQIDKNSQVQASLQKQLNAARTKVARAEQNQQTLACRKKGAEIRTALAKASQNMSDGKGLAALDELEDAVREEEAEATAFEEMAAPADEGLDEKYGSAGGCDAEDLAAKYMAKAKS